MFILIYKFDGNIQLKWVNLVEEKSEQLARKQSYTKGMPLTWIN